MPRPSVLLLAIITVAASIWLVADPGGLRRTLRLEADLQQIEATNERLRSENAALRRELKLLADDPAALERAAREELGLIRPGEVIFRLEESADEAGIP